MEDQIIRKIELAAPVEKVWQSIADVKEFEQWFHCKYDGPFEEGRILKGVSTYGLEEEYRWDAKIVSIQPIHYFSFACCPIDDAQGINFDNDAHTLVEFKLQASETGCLLTVIESGFSKLPADQASEAFDANSGGWDEQMKNISIHVENRSDS